MCVLTHSLLHVMHTQRAKCISWKPFCHVGPIRDIDVESNYFVIGLQSLEILITRGNDMTLLHSQALGLSIYANHMWDQPHILCELFKRLSKLSCLEAISPRLPPMRKLLEWILLFIQTVWHDVTSDFLTANKVENYATSLILNPLPLDEVDILPPSRKDNTLSPDSLSTLPFLRKLIHLLDAEISPTILSERCISIIQNQQAVALTLVVCLEPSTS